jgi:hypothetical protein
MHNFLTDQGTTYGQVLEWPWRSMSGAAMLVIKKTCWGSRLQSRGCSTALRVLGTTPQAV